MCSACAHADLLGHLVNGSDWINFCVTCRKGWWESVSTTIQGMDDRAMASLMQPGADAFDALETFLAGLQRPVWHSRAACRGVGAAVFFPTAGEGSEAARAFCVRCPVADQCLADAMKTGGPGVWGGTSARTRRAYRSAKVVSRLAYRTTVTATLVTWVTHRSSIRTVLTASLFLFCPARSTSVFSLTTSRLSNGMLITFAKLKPRFASSGNSWNNA